MPRIVGRSAPHLIASGSVTRIGLTAAQAMSAPPASTSNPAQAQAPSPASPHWYNRPSLGVFGEDKSRDVLLIGLCAAFSLIGWLMIVRGGEQIHHARNVAKWPTTVGIIASVDMQEIDGSEGARWRPQVVYYYSVNGRVISSTQLSRGQALQVTDERAARAFLAKYPTQSAVTVHYDPAEVTNSVLETNIPRSARLNLALGLVLAAAGPILLLIFGGPVYRRWAPSREPASPTSRADQRSSGPVEAHESTQTPQNALSPGGPATQHLATDSSTPIPTQARQLNSSVYAIRSKPASTPRP